MTTQNSRADPGDHLQKSGGGGCQCCQVTHKARRTPPWGLHLGRTRAGACGLSARHMHPCGPWLPPAQEAASARLEVLLRKLLKGATPSSVPVLLFALQFGFGAQTLQDTEYWEGLIPQVRPGPAHVRPYLRLSPAQEAVSEGLAALLMKLLKEAAPSGGFVLPCPSRVQTLQQANEPEDQHSEIGHFP